MAAEDLEHPVATHNSTQRHVTPRFKRQLQMRLRSGFAPRLRSSRKHDDRHGRALIPYSPQNAARQELPTPITLSL